jgi:hypothetical protein
MDQAVARSGDTRRDGPYTRSSFIIKAVHLKKMARSNGKKKSPVPQTYQRDLSAF